MKGRREERARIPAQAFIPLRFDLGEAYQFDWSLARGRGKREHCCRFRIHLENLGLDRRLLNGTVRFKQLLDAPLDEKKLAGLVDCAFNGRKVD